ncbi:MAG: TIM barrel protein [Gammaproteobacteria bacterium]|nr:MAG: TIM barrel protein [Gammaproteobacteria bacterium]
MPTKPAATEFRPRPMRLSILTAALQELTPRERRDADPDLGVEEWLEFARQIGAPNIELSAALHPTESDVPAAALLDPVANTLDLRKPFSAARAARVRRAMQSTRVGLSDLAYFDNMLAADESLRHRKHELMRRVFDAAVLLGADAVAGFVGRNPALSLDANLVMFEEVFIPLLKEAQARGLTYRVEQCPMPGWTIGDTWHNNIAYAPGPWIALHRICERHGVGDQFRIHYDPSHAILMGQDSRSVFQYLKDAGYDFLITGFHVKGQVIDSRGISAWGYGGQTMQRGDWRGGEPSPDPLEQRHAWKKQTVFCEHELPGTARHDPLAYLQNRTVDWLDHQLAARELLRIDPEKTFLVVEHEYPKARGQDNRRAGHRARSLPIVTHAFRDRRIPAQCLRRHRRRLGCRGRAVRLCALDGGREGSHARGRAQIHPRKRDAHVPDTRPRASPGGQHSAQALRLLRRDGRRRLGSARRALRARERRALESLRMVAGADARGSDQSLGPDFAAQRPL